MLEAVKTEMDKIEIFKRMASLAFNFPLMEMDG